MSSTITLTGKYADAFFHTNNVDQNTLLQVKELINCDVSEGSVIHIMPDCHAGKGCTIGTTMTITDKLCPNLVGVDVGCAIMCLKVQGDFSVEDFLDACEKVPAGVGKYNSEMKEFNDLKHLSFQLENKEQILYSIGSLGSGNHFIELNEDEDGNRYIVIHTGSRNLGIQVCSHHMEIAKKTNPRGLKGDLSFLTGTDLNNYLLDMRICQIYAQKNRMEIAYTILRNLGNSKKVDAFETVHNYIDFDDRILRKGAISCTKGKKVLIPFNMRDGSVIAIGKGNPDWNFSGPHGAGRILSRTQAKKSLSLEDFKKTMTGISSRTVCQNTIDEAPQVYKDAKEIESLISETVEVQKHLKVIANFKGF